MLQNIQALAARKLQKGLTTVEYAIAGGLIAAAVVTGFVTLGTNVGGVISGLANAVG